MTIRALPPAVADAIAAGEVVERPASVVKELVENSLDAGATRVGVEIRGAGKTLIRIVDDGAGIPSAELRLAFQRHATSKLQNLSDLEAIGTLGFRGEALASIAAVSDLEATTSGRRLHLRAGALLEEGAAGPAPGLVIEVRDLFANTPARLRFLKSDATETAACLAAVQRYALLYPTVRFRVIVEGRTSLSTDGHDPLASVYGEAVSREMLAVDHLNVTGTVSPPKLSRGTRDAMLLAVNRRPIASRTLAFALEECYRGALERGRYPVAVLNVEISPEAVDVNVHPTKREVKFRDEGAVFAALQRAVRSAIGAGEPARPPEPAAPGPSSERLLRQLEIQEPPPAIDPQLPRPASAGGFLRPVGQVLDGYLVAESPEGMVLIDQHAAHERVLFNRFQSRLEGAPAVSQHLLMAMTVELEPALAAGVADHEADLRSLGFEVEPFGPRAVRILAGPVETPPESLEPAFREVLAGLRARSADDALASLACHSAVRFGDALDLAEQRRLLQEMESLSPDITCPHGRPVRLLLDWQQLKRHFRRNY